MSHNIDDLRNHLFAALDGLADDKNPMEIERARAIADVARVIVDSAKAEIQLLSATGAQHTATAFIPLALLPPAGGCPSCGGRLKPETNGNGRLIDRCVNCGRSAAPPAQIPKRVGT